MPDRVFIDTNIFIYAYLEDLKDKRKHQRVTYFFEGITDEIIISRRGLGL